MRCRRSRCGELKDDRGSGEIRTGVTVYRTTSTIAVVLRIEAEYVHRRHGSETLPLVVPADPKQLEFTERSERIGYLRSHGVFVNLYHDFRHPRRSRRSRRAAPFVGAGVGWMRTQIAYGATSIRTSDRNALLDLGRNPNAAGTTSRADATLADDLMGYQLLAGVDHALRERETLTVKVRYVDAFGDFESLDNEWQQLRDHASTVGPGGAPVRYGIGARNPCRSDSRSASERGRSRQDAKELH